MRILDLFSGAGGAAVGYHRAFPDAEIIGVDIVVQPRFPFTFIQADAMTFPLDGFDLIHASPPCHDHSRSGGTARKRYGVVYDTGWMLTATIERLAAQGTTWIVENVEGAKFPESPPPFRLCGSSFGLDLHRHRLFASNFVIEAPPCDHAWQTPRFQSLQNNNRKAGKLAKVVGVYGHAQYPGDFELRKRAMGIDWMTLDELNESIPPAYTYFIGRALRSDPSVCTI